MNRRSFFGSLLGGLSLCLFPKLPINQIKDDLSFESSLSLDQMIHPDSYSVAEEIEKYSDFSTVSGLIRETSMKDML